MELTNAIQELLAIADDNYLACGIRIDRREYAVGETMLPSRQWSDGDPTEEVLDGTSCMHLTDAQESAQIYVNAYRTGTTYYAYLVSGKSLYDGRDPGETVVGDAEVLAAIKLTA